MTDEHLPTQTLQRAFGYLRNMDQNLGNRVEKGIRNGKS